MNNHPQFRLAGESDADALLEFMEAYYAFDGHGFDREKARAALTALLLDANLGLTWLILDGDAAVGYVVLCFGYSLEWLGRDAFVDEFYLRDEYRGRGWGRTTMEFVEEAARAAGVRALHLEVVRENSTALQVYRKLGFAEHESTFSVEMDCAGFFQAAGAERPLIRYPRRRFCTSRTFCSECLFCYASSALPRLTLGRRTLPAEKKGGYRASTDGAWFRFGRVAGHGANGAGAGFFG